MDFLPYFAFVIFLANVSSRSVPKIRQQNALEHHQESTYKHLRHLNLPLGPTGQEGAFAKHKAANFAPRHKERKSVNFRQESLSSRAQSRKLLEVDDVGESDLEKLLRSIRSESNNTQPEFNYPNEMDADDILKTREFGNRVSSNLSPDDAKGQGSGDESIIGTASDYVLIAMIVAMMFCMTLCCLCLFCRSSSRLSICGINFELNDRRNSINAGEDLSEIHEVVPLTPTTAGEHNNRLPDIESMLRADAPPPLYNEIVCKESEKRKLERKTAVSLHDEVKKNSETTTQEQQAKEVEAKASSTKHSKKKPRLYTQTSNTSEASSGNGRSSWKITGRGILASFRAKSSMLRQRRSDSGLQRHTAVEEGLSPIPCNRSDGTSPSSVPEPIPEEGGACKQVDAVTMETVNEVVAEMGDNAAKQNKVFVYDVNDLHDADDDVFM